MNYNELVSKAQSRYHQPKDKQAGTPFLVGLDDSFGQCNEINLYTYWQGRGYAEKTPSIKYLLVGQDWGNPMTTPESFRIRLKGIIQGKDLSYIDKENMDSGFQTDKNLIEFFHLLGYDIAQKRYDELFFTNFCLGYRSGKNSGRMRKELMNKDKDSFQDLCRILQPKNILCLGKNTFECVYAALVMERDKLYTGYMKYIEYHPQIIADSEYGGGRIYPLAHCGGLGMRNRPKDKQIADWKWVSSTAK